MGLPEGYPERVATYTPDIRYDKILEAFGGHTEHVTDPEQIRPALTRAFQATQGRRVACVNIISAPLEVMPSRSRRAGSLMGYDREERVLLRVPRILTILGVRVHVWTA
jgi:thiamine pyrophosphate-dependent acetolactate synthase large subunit-like protein